MVSERLQTSEVPWYLSLSKTGFHYLEQSLAVGNITFLTNQGLHMIIIEMNLLNSNRSGTGKSGDICVSGLRFTRRPSPVFTTFPPFSEGTCSPGTRFLGKEKQVFRREFLRAGTGDLYAEPVRHHEITTRLYWSRLSHASVRMLGPAVSPQLPAWESGTTFFRHASCVPMTALRLWKKLSLIPLLSHLRTGIVKFFSDPDSKFIGYNVKALHGQKRLCSLYWSSKEYFIKLILTEKILKKN